MTFVLLITLLFSFLGPTLGHDAHHAVNISYVWKHSKVPFDLNYMHMSMIESLGGNKLAVAFQAAKAHEGDNDQAIHPIHRHKPLPPATVGLFHRRHDCRR